MLCLHGAGDVALVWAQVARRLRNRIGGYPEQIQEAYENVPEPEFMLVTLLQFMPLAVTIVAADLRGHGGAMVEERLDESLGFLTAKIMHQHVQPMAASPRRHETR